MEGIKCKTGYLQHKSLRNLLLFFHQPIEIKKPLIRIIQGPILAEAHMFIDNVQHTVRLHNSPGKYTTCIALYAVLRPRIFLECFWPHFPPTKKSYFPLLFCFSSFSYCHLVENIPFFKFN